MMPADSSLTDIARNVWESTLGMAVLESALGRGAQPAPHVWFAVDITGHVSATVLLCVPVDAARCAGAVMFDQTVEGTSMQDANEAVSELANIIGGDIKGILGGTNRLSLPRPARADETGSPKFERLLWFNTVNGEFAVLVAVDPSSAG